MIFAIIFLILMNLKLLFRYYKKKEEKVKKIVNMFKIGLEQISKFKISIRPYKFASLIDLIFRQFKEI